MQRHNNDDSSNAKMLVQAAGVCFAQKHFLEAQQLLLQALDIRRRAKGPNHRKLAPILNCLGLTYSELGRFEESQQAFLEALAIVRRNPRPGRFREMEILQGYSSMLHRFGRTAEASEINRELSLLEKQNGLFRQLGRHGTPSVSMVGLRIIEILDSDELEMLETHVKKRSLAWFLAISLLLIGGLLLVLVNR